MALVYVRTPSVPFWFRDLAVKSFKMKFYSHLNTAVQLLTNYNGDQPFHLYIKSFFKEHKKYGSKDRKNIAHLCYCDFRIGRSLDDLPINERIIAGVFLCSEPPNEVVDFFQPEWNKVVTEHLSLKNRIITWILLGSLLVKFALPRLVFDPSPQ